MDYWAESLISNRVNKSFESKKDRKKPQQYKFASDNSEVLLEEPQETSGGNFVDRRVGPDRRKADTGVAKRFDPRNKRDRRKYAKISCKI